MFKRFKERREEKKRQREEDKEALRRAGTEFLEQYEAASPAERDQVHNQIEGIARLLGVKDDHINTAKNALGIKPLGAVSEKAARLESLRKEYQAALARCTDPNAKADLEAVYDIERRKILES
jgi:hypothetical protein